MDAQAKSAIIKAASDWAMFLFDSPRDHGFLAKDSQQQLIDNFANAYGLIQERLGL